MTIDFWTLGGKRNFYFTAMHLKYFGPIALCTSALVRHLQTLEKTAAKKMNSK